MRHELSDEQLMRAEDLLSVRWADRQGVYS
jgi:hypothetical protein